MKQQFNSVLYLELQTRVWPVCLMESVAADRRRSAKWGCMHRSGLPTTG